MVLFDFDAPGLSGQWQMAGGGSASREACEVGWCLHVRPAPRSGIGSRSVPKDWTGFGELRFRAQALAATSIEVRIVAGEGRATFWRRVDLHAGWQHVQLALGWFRRGEGAAPSWSTVKALSFSFRDATEVWLAEIEIVDGSPVLTPQAVATVIGGATFRGGRAAVVTPVSELDGAALASRLDAVADVVFADLPFLREPGVPVPVAVFADVPAYRAGVVQLGRAFNATVAAPSHDGFTMEGIATSSWDPAQGIERRVFVHEFVHALLTRAAALPNGGEWLQEGLANWYQVRFHPQDNLREVVRGRLAKPISLSRLCDGQRIDPTLYGDAWAAVGTLLEESRWAGTMARVFAAAAATGTTSLAAMGVDLAALERDRRAWAARRFGW